MDWLRTYGWKIVLLVSSSVFAAGVFVTSVWAGGNNENHVAMLRIGAVMAVAVVLVAATDAYLSEREKEQARKEVSRAAAALALSYHSVLTPLSTALGALAQRQAAAYQATGAAPVPGQAGQTAVALRTVVVGGSVLAAEPDPASHLPTARCAFYRRDGSTGHRFVREDWAGPSPAPRFVLDGAEGAHLLHGILEPHTPFHAGKETGLRSVIDPMSPTYGSVIAVPVAAGSREIGVLCVDAPRDTDLTGLQVELMKSLAGYLGTALALE
ncbi:GAF domain-containing protein [Actinacidiphila sp. ITFR-21]|uniref:GAF domain-containing protein n=1 Tax=Actinacidiphila sp. ITFR-21 TaxID=3075199 RepID=UPI00288B4250|nr:GAF domain-containing protein [Streptomyces sp. ITFR-21]WNI17043.1 GAF domain-containing protein [Streptomyces sp. ITFR-21]